MREIFGPQPKIQGKNIYTPKDEQFEPENGWFGSDDFPPGDPVFSGSQPLILWGVYPTKISPILLKVILIDTPWKINMEPKNHLFEKDNHLPNLHYYVPC